MGQSKDPGEVSLAASQAKPSGAMAPAGVVPRLMRFPPSRRCEGAAPAGAPAGAWGLNPGPQPGALGMSVLPACE